MLEERIIDQEEALGCPAAPRGRHGGRARQQNNQPLWQLPPRQKPQQEAVEGEEGGGTIKKATPTPALTLADLRKEALLAVRVLPDDLILIYDGMTFRRILVDSTGG